MMARYLGVVVGLLVLVSVVRAADLGERWVYTTANLDSDANLARMLQFLDEWKQVGITHMLLSESKTGRLNMVGERYFANVKKFLEAAKERNIEIVLGVFPVGYGGSLLVHDGNMAAGMPARNIPFVVQNGVAVPEPDPLPLKNGDFEQAEGDKLADWTQPHAGAGTSVDREVKHGGSASLRIEVDKLPRDANGTARLEQTFPVKPFRHYRLSVWAKTENLRGADAESFVIATSSGGKRRNTYTNLGISENQDWTQHQLIFNTLEATELRFTIGVSGARGGTLWLDDLTIEPAGLMHVLRRQGRAAGRHE